MSALGPARAALAQLLHETRLRVGLTQGDVAAAIGRSAGSVSAFERGHRTPPSRVLDRYGAVLGIDPRQLRDLQRASLQESVSERERDREFESRYAAFILDSRQKAAEDGSRGPLPSSYLSVPVVASQEDGPMVTVEEALARRRRVVLRGSPGSGKTTQLLRIHDAAARKIRLRDKQAAGPTVPFLFRVPYFTRGLPDPADFLRGLGQPFPHEPPDGWSVRVLEAGRGLLLVDGLDEVGPEERDRVRAWLGDVLSAYPDARCVVTATTRPTAVRPSWVEQLGFEEFGFGPLGFADIRRFVDHWLAERNSRGDEYAPVHGRDDLLDALQRNTGLRDLLINPAMCALLCTLFYEGDMNPPSRAELCQAVLSSRLRPRPTVSRPAAGQSAEEQTLFLQRIAVFMQRNGLIDAPRDEAVRQIRRVLGSLGAPTGRRATPEGILEGLLDRSGVLTASGWNTVAFVHPAFGSYLAAREILASAGITELVMMAHDDHWRDAVVFAVGLARPHERDELLRRILSRGDTEPEDRVRLWLTAAQAGRESALLNAGIAGEAERRLVRIIPPRDFHEAAALARSGPHVIDLLPGPDEIPPHHPALPFLLRTAELIGGWAGDTYRARFPTSPSDPPEEEPQPPSWHDGPSLPPLVLESWSHGSARRREATAPFVELTDVEGPVDLTALEDDARRLVLRGDVPVVQALRGLNDLHTLVIEDNPSLKDLLGIARLPRLRTLVISRCRRLNDLTGLAESGVMFLELDLDPYSEVLAGLASATRLRALYLPYADMGFEPAQLGRRLPGVAVLPRLGIRH